MSQIEIPIHNRNSENASSRNLENNQLTRLTSKITVLKAGVTQYQHKLNEEHKLEHSSSKLYRVSSSKGISVMSRPTSSEKQVTEFSASELKSQATLPQTQVSIKLQKKQENSLLEIMRNELLKVNQVYQQKIKQEHSHINTEIVRLNELLRQRQSRITKQERSIEQLSNRIQSIQKKTQSRVNRLEKQLANFRLFYDQCFDYSIWRVNDIDNRMGCLFRIVESQTNSEAINSARSKLELGYEMIKNIAVSCGVNMLELKTKTHQQLFELELMLGESNARIEKLAQKLHELQEIDFGNSSLEATLRDLSQQSVQLLQQLPKNGDSPLKFSDYDCKFQQILKRVNSACIEIELIQTAQTAQQIEQLNKEQQTYIAEKSELKRELTVLTQQLQAQEISYKRQIDAYRLKIEKLESEIENARTSKNPQTLKLQEMLQKEYSVQSDMKLQISELKSKIGYYEVKCERSSQLEISLQTSLAEAYSESMVKEKVRMWEDEKKVFTKQISDLEDQIKGLDHQNYLLAEKLACSNVTQDNTKMKEEELKFLQSENLQISQQNRNLQSKLQKLMQDISALQVQTKQQQTAIARNEAQIHYKELQHGKMNQLITQMNDNLSSSKQYISQLQEKLESLHCKLSVPSSNPQTHDEQKQLQNHIQTLEGELDEYEQEIEYLRSQNAKLEAHLGEYAVTFEKQSKTFRDAINNLQKEKDCYAKQVDRLTKQNTDLRYNSDCQSTVQSFYQNSPMAGPVFRKTCSSELDPARKPEFKKNHSLKPLNIDRIHKLKNVILKVGYEMPTLCEIDETGNLKHEKSGTYFVDEDENLFDFSQQQLSMAVAHGIILL